MTKIAKSLVAFRERFLLNGTLNIIEEPHYDNAISTPVVLINKSKSVYIEVGAVVAGFVTLFPDMVNCANGIVTLCETLIDGKHYGHTEHFTVYTSENAGYASGEPCRVVSVKTDKYSYSCAIDSLDNVQRALIMNLADPSRKIA